MTSRGRGPRRRARTAPFLARALSGGVCALAVASGAVNVAQPGQALATPTAPIAFVQEPFTNGQVQVSPDWEAPAVPSLTNAACLTAATSTTQVPIPGCGGSADTAGHGALRLTGANTDEEGGVASTVALPSAQGIDITFDTYQYGSSSTCTGDPVSSCAGDGLMFFLAAANPTSPEPPSSLGEPGGYLAYSGNTNSGGGNGLVNGYLGVGLDIYGNYTNNQFDGGGCSDPSWAGEDEAVPDQVTVRGPGSGTAGYCLLSSTAAGGGLRGQLATSSTGAGARASSEVPVEVAVNPTGSAYTTQSGIAVPAYSYVIAVTPLGAATQLVSGTLPYDSYLPSSDLSWLNPVTGIPRQFIFGFAASTGTYDDIHEVTNVQAAPLSANPAQLGLSVSDSAAGVLVRGSSDTYTETPLVSATGGAETAAPTVETTFPAGVTPGSGAGTNWSCSTAASIVTCNYTGPLPIAAGTSLPSVTLPATVSGSASGAQAVSAAVWENGAIAAQAADTGTAQAGAQAAPALGLTWTDSDGGQLAQGQSVTYTANGQVSAEGGADSGAITFSTSFPPGQTPDSAGGTDWSCTVSAPNVGCTWTGGTVSAGAVLNPISVVVAVGADATGGAEVSGTLSSASASPPSVAVNDYAVVASTPALGAQVTDNEAGAFTRGTTVDYAVTVSLPSSGWNEADAPVVTDNFPDVFSAVTEDASSTAWSCTQPASEPFTEKCTYTGSLPIAAGSTLQTLEFDSTVDSTGLQTGTVADDSVSVQSNDAPVAVGTDYARIGEGPAPNFSIAAYSPPTATSSYSLTINTAVLSNGGETSNKPTVEAQLPSGESFSSDPAPSGWNCTLSGTGSTLLTCTTTLATIAAGSSLTAIQATVVPTAGGLHTVQVTMSDSQDGAFEVATACTTDSLPPVLGLNVSPMSAQASAGGTYTMSLAASTNASGGEAFNSLSLSVQLPSGESFPSTPAASGWTCTVPGTNDTQLTCTSSSPVAPGTTLTSVVATVETASTDSGTLTASATLQDAADGATSVQQSPSVTIGATTALSVSTSGTPSGASAGSSYTPTFSAAIGPGGDAYNEPSLTVTLPSGESFPATAPTATGWTCTVSGTGDNTLGCTATASLPVGPGTSLGGVTPTVDIAPTAPHTALTTNISLTDTADGATASNTTAAVTVTAAPVLSVSFSGTTPAKASANSSYSITLSSSLTSTGPAYHDPQLAVDLPSGETFATPAPTPANWGCTLSAGNADLDCTSSRSAPIGASSNLGSVTATVDIASNASLTSLTTNANLTDTQDDATAGTATQSVQVTATPVLDLTTTGTPSAATVGNSYTVQFTASLTGGGGVAYNEPTLTVDLPTGEVFTAGDTSQAGWNCSLSAGNADLSCTSTASLPISVGTVGTIAALVDIVAGASGILTTSAALSDSSDGAATFPLSPAVDATPAPVMSLSLSGTPSGAAAGTNYPLTIDPSVAVAGGPAYSPPAVVVTLPNGETFSTSAITPPGWSCALSGGDTVLSCTSQAFVPIATGSSLGNIVVTVDIGSSARGTLTTDASLTDSRDDGVPATAQASVTVTAPPALGLLTTGTPSSASAPGSYSLTLTPSVRSTPGPAYNALTLTVTLPSGEEAFQAPAPTPSGWSCAYSSGGAVITCQSTVPSPIAAGTTLTNVVVTVDISSGASGTLTTFATLSDSADLATPVTQSPAVGITPSSPPSPGPEPPPVPVGPSPTTTTAPTGSTTSTTTSSSTTSTSTSSTTTTSTTTTSTTTTTSPNGKLGPGPEQTVLPPLLEIKASAPASARAGGSFTLELSISLASKGGPAYHDPAFSVDLPGRMTFAKRVTGGSDWSCAVAVGDAVLTCTWKAKVPLRAGGSLGTVSAAVDVASTASGRLTARATVADTADAARPAEASATVTISKPAGAKSSGPGAKGGGSTSTFASHYGYRLVATDGGVFSFGNAKFYGSCQQTTKPCGPTKKIDVTGMAGPSTGTGYWLVAASGAVYTFGHVQHLGSCPGDKKICGKSSSPVVGITATTKGQGYWLVTKNGTIFAFGDAHNYGSCASSKKACIKRSTAIVGMAVTSDGKGYWLVASSGSVYSFGDAKKFTSCTTSEKPCRAGQITAIVATTSGQGYWLVGSSGRVYAFGDAKFLGDAYTAKDTKGLRGTIVGIGAMSNDAGYWLVSSEGLVIALEGAKFMGDIYTAKVKKLQHPVTGMAST